ncbi:MAG: DUF4339 domain-containing protein [Kiritimatiellae bacterium]|nr:DUF4339 domain-containing protein [Kiritimatiellia bacterium]
MNNNWYYIKDGEQFGPLSLDELQSLVAGGALLRSDVVWCPEFGSQWREVESVDELTLPPAPAIATPPPLKTPRRLVEFESVTGNESFRPSVRAAVRSSWQWMQVVLFRPFNVTRWFSIGFCAWLTSLGSCNGLNLQEKAGEGSGVVGKPTVDAVAGKSVDLLQNPASLSALLVGILLILGIYALILRLKSRGDFMFLRRWYTPDATIGACWRESLANGGKFFRWRLCFYSFILLSALLNGVFVYRSFLMPYVDGGYVWDVIYAQPVALAAMTALVIWLAFLTGESFGVGFVVPILHWHSCSVSQAWRKVFELCNQFPGAVLLYVLSLIGMWLCFAVGLVLVLVMTCCIAALPLVIPYVGMVCLLPVYYFFRGYSICFIAQWRDGFIPVTGTNAESAP